jgi:RecA-family ATPase
MAISPPITFSQLRSKTFPPGEHIIGEGLLRKGGKLVIAGAPKTYKSFIANTILVQCLTGGYLFGTFTNHSRQREDRFPITPVERVLLIEQELGEEDHRDRMLPYWNSLSPEDRAKVDHGFYLESCEFDLRLDKLEGLEAMNRMFHEIKPQIVCFDPLIKFHRLEENNPSQMNTLMCNLGKLAWAHHLSPIINHHFNKDPDKKELDALRGASSIAGDLDSCLLLNVSNRNAGIISVEPVLKRGKPIHPFLVKLDFTTLRTEFHRWLQKADLPEDAAQWKV